MPIYMDVHTVPGVNAKDVAEAHRKDLFHQEDYDCKCMTYWVDEERESIFCLIEAPNKQAVEAMHSKAHGLIPNRIIEVSNTVVQSFLGRIYDPEKAEITDDGLKVFSDSSFRTLLVTTITDPVILKHNSGGEKIVELLTRHNSIIRKNVSNHGGREVEYAGAGFIVSFAVVAKAVACALAIQKDISNEEADITGLKIAVNAGEPVEKSNKLFGDTIRQALNICAISRKFRVAISSSVKELLSKDYLENNHHDILLLSPQGEHLMELLFRNLEENWQNPDFDIPDYCKAMAMSNSQLYRKTIILTGLSPNILLKEFRLEKAKELLQKQYNSISQITFDSGFTSPSYFTKCFKKKYNLLPMLYVELLR
jgi:AraC-like DNA-binding protein